MAVKVAINGFGRIGRLAFRLLGDDGDVDIVAVNDLTDANTLAHLLKYDSNHGKYKVDGITAEDGALIVDGKRIPVFSEKDPALQPWGDLGVDVVLECTGRLTDDVECQKHIDAGAKKVIISAPGKGDMKTIVFNVNHNELDGTETIISGASCTTNCLAPMVKVLDDAFGIEFGYMTTVHAYTNDQMVLDGNHKDLRRARAAAVNIIPTSTGAASSVGLVMPHLQGKLDGFALRVPVSTGSLVDFTCSLAKQASKEEIKQAFIDATNETIEATSEPIVSTDIIGNPAGSIVDLGLIDFIEADGKRLVKVVSWYDNEAGYTYQLIRLMKHVCKLAGQL
ncbi:MAG: type I glyceraldehyde-3-phosphate dehydrogenase [Eubacteriaceae bacterium]|nr:type I glyceraldehyde-3-phosphate dehydrogenase [Eubacteriaceae bacterium]